MDQSLGSGGDEVLDIFHQARQLRICPNRIWAVAGEKLPRVIPELHLLLAAENELDAAQHAECTPDFCEQAQRDFTGIQQRHECSDEARCTTMAVSFPRDALYNAAIQEKPTAWALTGEAILQPHLPYMAISHVWSDGTGAGAWKDGSVNECLYELFENLARKFNCEGIWWDTISIPREKAARTKAIKKMHDNYEHARITLVHDCFLREWLWDPRTACFGIIMSPWFSRGWTALELMKSRKVKIIFRGRWGPVIKDLDEEILAKVDEPDNSLREASSVIRNLRQDITKLNDLLTVLRSRYTSWPKDVAVISALLVGVPVQERQQEIFKSIVRRFGRITPGHLFHNATTVSTTFTWCPAKLFDLPLDPSDPSLNVSGEGHVRGVWRVIEAQPAVTNHIWWGSTHPLIRRQLQHALLDIQQCRFLAEFGPNPIKRALLVRQTKERGHYRFVGAVHFHSEWTEDCHQVEDTVTISSFQDDMEPHLHVAHDADVLSQDSTSSLSTADRSERFRRAIWTGDYPAFLNYMEEDILEVPDKLGRRPLHLAAERGNGQMVENLLFIGVELSAQCDQGQTALHYAAWGGSVAVVHLLKDKIEQTTRNKKRNMALHVAAQMGFAPVVEALRNQYFVNMEGCNGLTPVHFAAINGHLTVVEVLSGWVYVDAKDEVLGWTPLHCAVDSGNQDIVDMLMRLGANIDSRDTRAGWTPLHLAAMHGNSSLIRILQAAGANMLPKDNLGWTPFTFAKINKHDEALKLLSDKGSAKVTPKAKFWTPLHCKAVNKERGLSKLLTGDDGQDYVNPIKKKLEPLKFAVEHNLEITTRWLLDAGASWPIEYNDDIWREWNEDHGTGKEDSSESDVDDSSESDVDDDDGWGDNSSFDSNDKHLVGLRVRGARPNGPWTPMHWAAQNDYAVALRILIERKEDVNADGPHSWTPLHFAAYLGHATAIRLLLQAGAGRNPKIESKATPLIMAAAKGHTVVVRMLLEAGSRYDEADDDGRTPLLFAAEKGHTAVADLLLQAGASVDLKDMYGQTPLVYACEEGSVHIVRLLLKAGANMEFAGQGTDYYLPSISIAARYGFKRILRLLLDAGADIDSRDKMWRTPLMHAAMFGQVEIVRVLLDAGAKIDLQDSQGRKAIHWAAGAYSNHYYDEGLDLSDNDEDIRTLFEDYVPKSECDSEEGSGEKSKEKIEEEFKDIPEYAKRNHFHPSVWWNLEPVVRLLLDAGETVDSKGQKESTPLFLAALMGHKEMVKLLLSRGANVNSRDRRSKTPLMVAVYVGNEEIIQILLDSGARANLKGKMGNTAFNASELLDEDSSDEENEYLDRLRRHKGTGDTNEESSDPAWHKRVSDGAKGTTELIKFPIRYGVMSARGRLAALPKLMKRHMEKFDESDRMADRGKQRNTFN